MIRPRVAVTVADVADHYDDLDPMYRDIWGQHVHHGFWATGGESSEDAVIALAELVGDQLELSPGQSVCDIGCGYGGTAQLFAERHGVAVTGITISTAQAAIAVQRVPAQGSLAFTTADWLANRFADAAFDRAYAIESSEHMVDKPHFFAEARRVLKPDGRLVVCAWLAAQRARAWEARHLLEPICREGRLPSMGTEAEYRAMAAAAGFRIIDVLDISREVRRTWTLCLQRIAARTVTDGSYLRYLLDRRSKNRVFLRTLARLVLAYRTGAMRYCVLVLDAR